MSQPIPLTPGADEGIKDTVINQNFQDLSARFVTNVLKDETGTNRYMQGQLPDGSYGVRVSKEGVDVTTTDDDGLIYKDDFSTTTYYDDTDDRILIGKFPDGTYGMAISKEGESVTTALGG